MPGRSASPSRASSARPRHTDTGQPDRGRLADTRRRAGHERHTSVHGRHISHHPRARQSGGREFRAATQVDRPNGTPCPQVRGSRPFPIRDRDPSRVVPPTSRSCPGFSLRILTSPKTIAAAGLHPPARRGRPGHRRGQQCRVAPPTGGEHQGHEIGTGGARSTTGWRKAAPFWVGQRIRNTNAARGVVISVQAKDTADPRGSLPGSR